jgi:hypothetical protein
VMVSSLRTLTSVGTPLSVAPRTAFASPPLIMISILLVAVLVIGGAAWTARVTIPSPSNAPPVSETETNSAFVNDPPLFITIHPPCKMCTAYDAGRWHTPIVVVKLAENCPPERDSGRSQSQR